MVLEIITVMPNSPAEKAGVLPGDRVMYVGVGEDKILVQESGYTEAVNSLRGEKGTEAKFTVFRPQKDGSFEEIPFQIVRDEYEVQSVEYKISETDSTVGIVRILQFAQKTPQQFSEAMDDLIARGITKFVFDVRNNPGGDLKSINAILSYFLNEGDKILSTEDRAGNTEEYRVGAVSYTGDYEPCSVSKTDIGKYRGCQATVLTNGNTASAAELFTATMRDYTLATIVGETTYGKGSMQSIYPLYYWGYEGAVKLTTKHYFPPCGEGYDGVGITPDVVVSLSEEAANINIYKLAEADDDQLQAALALLKAS
jgi:carboxyl-terminal processing protease